MRQGLVVGVGQIQFSHSKALSRDRIKPKQNEKTDRPEKEIEAAR
jgi:hypothetical protein